MVNSIRLHTKDQNEPKWSPKQHYVTLDPFLVHSLVHVGSVSLGNPERDNPCPGIKLLSHHILI